MKKPYPIFTRYFSRPLLPAHSRQLLKLFEQLRYSSGKPREKVEGQLIQFESSLMSKYGMDVDYLEFTKPLQ